MDALERWLNMKAKEEAKQLVDLKQPNLNDEQREAMITIIAEALKNMIISKLLGYETEQIKTE